MKFAALPAEPEVVLPQSHLNFAAKLSFSATSIDSQSTGAEETLTEKEDTTSFISWDGVLSAMEGGTSSEFTSEQNSAWLGMYQQALPMSPIRTFLSLTSSVGGENGSSVSYNNRVRRCRGSL